MRRTFEPINSIQCFYSQEEIGDAKLKQFKAMAGRLDNNLNVDIFASIDAKRAGLFHLAQENMTVKSR